MLKAVERGKLRVPFQTKEDSLTSSVFQLLLYLPQKIYWEIFRSSVYQGQKYLPEDPGELKQIDFWPKWDPIGTGNKRYIEPDVFLSFDVLDIIIEAKRWDRGHYNLGQWKKELRSYANENKPGNKLTVIWALGGISKIASDLIHVSFADGVSIKARVVKSTWQSLLHSIQSTIQAKSDTQVDGRSRLYNDLILTFALHGFRSIKWLYSMPETKYGFDLPIQRFSRGISERWSVDSYDLSISLIRESDAFNNWTYAKQ